METAAEIRAPVTGTNCSCCRVRIVNAGNAAELTAAFGEK
jgi:hypothetical protein